MAFRLMDSGFGAVDEARGITIRMANRFADAPEWVPYDYIEGDLRFGFKTRSEVSSPGSHAAITHILESSIKSALFKVLGADALEKVDFDRIKKDILDGVRITEAGDTQSPQVKVDFIS